MAFVGCPQCGKGMNHMGLPRHKAAHKRVEQNLQYVIKHYGLDIREGSYVETPWGRGKVTDGSNYVHVLIDGKQKSTPWHPQDIKVLIK
jgi:hypothetical protein